MNNTIDSYTQRSILLYTKALKSLSLSRPTAIEISAKSRLTESPSVRGENRLEMIHQHGHTKSD